jgi:hypothetical protein
MEDLWGRVVVIINIEREDGLEREGVLLMYLMT